MSRANLLNFLKEEGRPLLEYGSAEFGVDKDHAMQFLKMLERGNLHPLGIEIWRYTGDWYSCDVMSGWYSSKSVTSIDEARRYLKNIDAEAQDVFTIQF